MIARLLTAVLLLALPQAEKIRVACVGDSITYGACVQDREKNCYPAVLSGLLGDTHDVRNFGVNGATLLKKGNFPWWTHQAFRDATSFDPQIVVIALGTNDTKPVNWKGKADFEADYKALIEHFKALPSKPAVWLALPVPVLKESFAITKQGSEEQQPMILKVAKEEGCSVIDLHTAVASPDLFDPDGIHPNASGAKKIAETVYASLAAKKPKAGK